MSTKTRGHHQHHTDFASNTETTDGREARPGPTQHRIGTEERAGLIRVRAYQLWQRAGGPHGDDSRERFWCEAEKEFTASPAMSQ
jgi:hypothetical protein